MATQITTKGVLTINGKQVEETFNNLRKLTGQLDRDLRKLPVGSEEFIKKTEELKVVSARFNEVKNQINDTKKSAQQLNVEAKSVGGTFGDMRGQLESSFASLLSGEISFKKLGGTIKLFAAQSWAAIGSIPIIGWLAALAAGIGMVIKEAVDYNQEISPLMKLLDNLGLDKKIIPQLRAIKDAFGVETEEIADMLDNLVDSGLVTDQAKALETLKIALAKAPNKAELISFLNSSAESAKKLGLSFSQLINIKQDLEATPLQPEKVFGAMDAFVNRILSQSEKIQPTLEKSFGGNFTKNLFKGVTDGSLKYADALNLIYKKGEELKISDKERADIGKALFGKSGASAYAYNEILKTISSSYRNINEDLSESQKKTLKLADAYEEMEKKKDEAFNSSTLRAFMFDIKILWINVKTWALDAVSGIVNGFKLIWMNASATFSNIPKYARLAFVGISTDLLNLFELFGSGKNLLKDLFTFKFDKLDGDLSAIKSKFQNAFKGITAAGKEIGKDFGVYGNINQNTIKQIAAGNKSKADALSEVEKRGANREAPEGKVKEKNRKEKNVKDTSEKDASDRKKALDDMIKDEEEANKKLLDLQREYQNEKTKLINDEFQKEFQQEVDRRNQEESKALIDIAELEKKKFETKSLVAKATFQKGIDQLHANEILNEETHQFNMLSIQQKWDAKIFEQFTQAEQRKITESRRLDEDEINNISTMEEAELALSQMKYLKLTDQELAGIKTLEDAKRALREDADRAVLDAQFSALEAQKTILLNALKDPALQGAALDELNAKLLIVNASLTQVKSSINGGTEGNQKKIIEEGRAAMGKVDILGFSATQWVDTFEKLDTTEQKIAAVKMGIEAMSNAFAMFSQLQQNLTQKELASFTRSQDKKKSSLLKQVNEGYITQEEYNKGVQKLDSETERKKAEIALREAKNQKIMALANIAMNTASAIISIWAQVPKFDFGISAGVLTGIVSGLGAIQAGIVLATPLPSYDVGGFTGSGFGSPDKSGFKPAGIVHEGEWTAPKWMVESSRYANVLNWLESERLGTGMSFAEGGLSKSENISTSTNTLSTNTPNSEMTQVLSRVSNFLEYLIINGVIIEKSAKNGKQAEEMIAEWNNLKNKNKH